MSSFSSPSPPSSNGSEYHLNTIDEHQQQQQFADPLAADDWSNGWPTNTTEQQQQQVKIEYNPFPPGMDYGFMEDPIFGAPQQSFYGTGGYQTPTYAPESFNSNFPFTFGVASPSPGYTAGGGSDNRPGSVTSSSASSSGASMSPILSHLSQQPLPMQTSANIADDLSKRVMAASGVVSAVPQSQQQQNHAMDQAHACKHRNTVKFVIKSS